MRRSAKAVSTAVSLVAVLATLSIALALIMYTLNATLARAPATGSPVVERGAEHLVAYIYGVPRNFTMIDGNIVPVDVRVNCLIHNPGPVPASIERVLALSDTGSVVADVALPQPLALAPEEYKFVNVSQLLNLPSDFAQFKSAVNRLILKTGSGGVHGSIYARPEFIRLERPNMTITVWKNYTVEVTEEVAVTTTINFTVTLPQKKYTLISKVLESDDGVSFHDFVYGCCKDVYCEYCRKIYGNLKYTSDSFTVTSEILSKVWPEIIPTGGCNKPGSCYRDLSDMQTYQRCSGCGGSLPCGMFQAPKIYYIKGGEEVTVRSNAPTQYKKVRSAGSCWCEVRWDGEYCYMRVENWEYTYEFAGIRLVDMDTGEVYASVNKTSLTFKIWRNTRAEFLYVLKDKKKTWEQTFTWKEPERSIYDCRDILKQSGDPCNPPSREWWECYCQLDPNHKCCERTPKCICSLGLSVDYCCVEEAGRPGTKDCGSASIQGIECEWSGGRTGCRIEIKEGETVEGEISGWIKISLKPGWRVQKVYLVDMDGIISSCGSMTLNGEGVVVCLGTCSCGRGDPQSGRGYKWGSAKYFAVFVKE